MPISHPDYTIVRELGQGATATVYLAVQNALNRKVALKVLGRSLSADTQFVDRFLREGRIVAKLNHPHVVPVFDVDEREGRLFMAMEYLGGGTLSDRGKDFNVGELLACARQVADALDYAHGQGFVHRDIKPDNILFRSPDHAMLADFGIARATESLTRMTVTGAIIGTPSYMSPEQVTGSDLDGRADLYSLGVVLYELVTGHQPFHGDSIMSVGLQHLTAPIPPMPASCQCFRPIVEGLMAKKPEERIDSAASLVSALKDLSSSIPLDTATPIGELHTGQAPTAVPLTEALAGHTIEKPGNKRRWLIPATVVMAGLAAASVYLWPASEDPLPPSENQPIAGVTTPGSLDVNQSEDTATIDALIEDGRNALRSEQWFEPDGAVALFRQVLEQSDTHPEALMGLMDVRRNALRQVDLDINAGRYAPAAALLDLIENEWPADSDTAELRLDLSHRQASATAAASAQAQQQRITELLASARQSYRQGNWNAPDDDNALFHYRAVLEIEPDNAMALAGVDNVTEQLLNRAEQAVANSDFDVAAQWLSAAQSANPEYARTDSVDERLIAQRSTWAAQQRAGEQQRQFAARVEAVRQRADGWIADADEESIEEYEALHADISGLLVDDSENAVLLALKTMIEEQQNAAIAESSEEPDPDRFNVPVF